MPPSTLDETLHGVAGADRAVIVFCPTEQVDFAALGAVIVGLGAMSGAGAAAALYSLQVHAAIAIAAGLPAAIGVVRLYSAILRRYPLPPSQRLLAFAHTLTGAVLGLALAWSARVAFLASDDFQQERASNTAGSASLAWDAASARPGRFDLALIAMFVLAAVLPIVARRQDRGRRSHDRLVLLHRSGRRPIQGRP